ncbi:WD40-repeat-containing domain protein [Mycena epipterygia]|nr:WD40-repeat-containing domain protein [Mycena epipterygia]
MTVFDMLWFDMWKLYALCITNRQYEPNISCDGPSGTPVTPGRKRKTKVVTFAVTIITPGPSSNHDVWAFPAPASSTLTPGRTLMGHRRAITSTAIVAHGRNILSVSLDGTIFLWDVSSGEKIYTLSAGGGRYSPVTSMNLGDCETAVVPGSALAAPDSLEVDTSGKLLFCALQTKSFEVFDLGARVPVYTSAPGASPLTAIAYAPAHNLLAAGSGAGVIEVFGTHALDVPVVSFTRGEAGIADLGLTEDGQTLMVSTDDGLPFIGGVQNGHKFNMIRVRHGFPPAYYG